MPQKKRTCIFRTKKFVPSNLFLTAKRNEQKTTKTPKTTSALPIRLIKAKSPAQNAKLILTPTCRRRRRRRLSIHLSFSHRLKVSSFFINFTPLSTDSANFPFPSFYFSLCLPNTPFSLSSYGPTCFHLLHLSVGTTTLRIAILIAFLRLFPPPVAVALREIESFSSSPLFCSDNPCTVRIPCSTCHR